MLFETEVGLTSQSYGRIMCGWIGEFLGIGSICSLISVTFMACRMELNAVGHLQSIDHQRFSTQVVSHQYMTFHRLFYSDFFLSY